jgi:hypothetical protein
MWNCSSLIFHLITGVVFAFLGNHPQDAGTSSARVPVPKADLSVRLAIPGSVFETDRPIPVRVEIKNYSEADLWIALSNEQLFSFPVNLPLVIRDIHRRRVLPSTSWVHESPFDKGPRESWVRLPPRYFYGRDFEITQYESAIVNTPGRYEISVSYAGIVPSTGSSSNASRNKLIPKPTETPPEGANIFTGRIESNSVWVEVVAPSKNSK